MVEQADLAVRSEGPLTGRPILMIHGWTMSGHVESLDFEPILSTTTYRRLYIDLPGMGASPAHGITDLDSIISRISAFIRTHVLPSPFLLVGTSCGAYLARALAYEFSSSVDGLLLRVPVVEPESSRRDVDPFVPDIADSAPLASIPDAERETLGDIPIQTDDYVRALRLKAETAWRPAIEASDAKALDPIREDLRRYRVTRPMHGPGETFVKPALIVTGRQDTDVGYRDAWPLVACYPRATFVVMDRASHGLPVDESERGLFEALVRDWLRRVEETRRLQLLS